MSLTRRQFMKRAGVVTAGSLAGPRLIGNPFVSEASANTIGDRYQVTLFLDGGNDGLNTVIPLSNEAGFRTAYETFRQTPGSGGIRINPGEEFVPSSPMIDPGTGTALGLHPGLQALGSLYDAGKLAIIQGTGYPDYSLSHETSRNRWQRADPTAPSPQPGSGWLGRHLGQFYGPSDAPAVSISSSIAQEQKTTDTNVLAISRLRSYGFPFDRTDSSDNSNFQAAYSGLSIEAGNSPQPGLALIGNTSQATLQSTQDYPALHSTYEDERAGWSQLYDDLNSSCARDLKEIAKIIYGVENGAAGVNARFFRLRNGGYDTHADQGGATGQHYDLHEEVALALSLFCQEMTDMGVFGRMNIMVYSEFSRRLPQNSNGTDHGSQGPMFVIGDTVNGGVYGNHPNIVEEAMDDRENSVYSQDPGDAHRSTDFRDVYGTILKHHIGMDEASILTHVLPADVGPDAEYWTNPDLNMGFL